MLSLYLSNITVHSPYVPGYQIRCTTRLIVFVLFCLPQVTPILLDIISTIESFHRVCFYSCNKSFHQYYKVLAIDIRGFYTPLLLQNLVSATFAPGWPSANGFGNPPSSDNNAPKATASI
jgi:hypothetical protein